MAILTDPNMLADVLAQRVAELMGASGHTSQPEPYIGAAEAARYLDCGNRRIYDLREQGRLRCIKDGGRLLTRRSWIDDYLAEEND